ncbi:MAG: undecaprenyl/decaprenyl-phosphate alpha-N-acetylglucosaminyl 1-phosphate transferase [Pirellulales bacterium]|nr:undecaprenyl/decaprenyl-phosphate alpha-N-acetylglucosaminyl 1-phosphate transferase [Pirellulales bacterium]
MGSEPTIFTLAVLVSLVLTALIREIAPRFGLTDNPDGHRKLHGRATSLGGGLAVYLTTAIILGTLWIVPLQWFQNPSDTTQPNQSEVAKADRHATVNNEGEDVASTTVRAKLRAGYPGLPALLLAGLVIVVVGLIDDKKILSGKQKLVGQIVAASILILDGNGLLIERIEFLGYPMTFGYLAFPLTLFWLLGAINSLNLLDGIDGLATMLGIILSCTIAAMSVVTGNHGVAIIAMVFAASLMGFMRFNYPPATIFLGDAGSMLIGLVVGALAIRGSLKASGAVLLAAPLVVWTLPILDSVAAVLRRKLTGRSIYATDRGHLHHRLLNLLGNNRRVLTWVAICCTVLSVATVIGLHLEDDRIMLLTCLAVVLIFITTGIFGRVELLLVSTRLRRVGHTLIWPFMRGSRGIWKSSIRLQGSQKWDLLWAAFIESAEKLSLTEVRLDVNMPTVHEAYHAVWECPRRSKESVCWHVEVPLVASGRSIGQVRISGERNGQSACLDIQHLMELIEPFEARMQMLDASPDAFSKNGEENSATGHMDLPVSQKTVSSQS